MLSKVFVPKCPFNGLPKVTDFQIIEEIIPDDLQEGEILAKAEWLTVDAWMRLYGKPGEPLPGCQVARIIKSRNPKFPEGSQICGFFGWRDYTVFKPKGQRTFHSAQKVPDMTSLDETYFQEVRKMPDMQGLPDSHALGVIGMSGITAYFGLLDICKPKQGETLVVTGAAGAVGYIVGQIGKIKGCRVIGFAGSDEKVKWLQEELGFDAAINYKKITDLDAVLKEHAPNGIDCYFDNVGGEFLYYVMRNMKAHGRIAMCGSVSEYNANNVSGIHKIPFDPQSFVRKSLKLEGFIVSQYGDRWMEGLTQLREWVLQGKIKARESITEGFENMPHAFIELLQGNNLGKQVVKA